MKNSMIHLSEASNIVKDSLLWSKIGRVYLYVYVQLKAKVRGQIFHSFSYQFYHQFFSSV